MESTTGGSGDVHAHLSSQPDKGEGMSGKYDLHQSGPAGTEEGRGLRDRAAGAYEAARERGGEMRGRIGNAAHRARDRAEDIFDDAEIAIEERTGALTTVRRNPVAALGIAFALGFLLAGDSEETEVRHPTVAKAKNQIKGAIMGGISAALSQQLRTFIEEQGGIGTLLATLGVPVPGSHGQPYFTPDDELRDA